MAQDAPRPLQPTEPPPRPQRLMDNILLLLAVGLIVPTIFYIVWGLVSLTTVPPFPR